MGGIQDRSILVGETAIAVTPVGVYVFVGVAEASFEEVPVPRELIAET